MGVEYNNGSMQRKTIKVSLLTFYCIISIISVCASLNFALRIAMGGQDNIYSSMKHCLESVLWYILISNRLQLKLAQWVHKWQRLVLIPGDGVLDWPYRAEYALWKKT